MESEPRQLHGLSWLFLTAKSAKGLILPAIFLLFASAANPWLRFELLGFVFLIPTLIGALIQQQIYRYRFGIDELIVRDGILTKKERHIPFDRIHNISVVRNPFHRTLDVASARIETAGGGKPEAVMRVLSLAAVDELRQRTLGIPAAVESPGDDGESAVAPATLLALRPGELFRMGLISGGSALFLAASAGALSQIQWWELDWIESSRIVQGEPPGWLLWLLDSGSLSARAVLILVGLLLLLVVMRLFSVGWHLVKYHGFVLQRLNCDLRMEFGLLTRVSSLLPVHRIQLITAHTTLPHRFFGRSSIDLEIAGSSEEGSDLQKDLAQSGLKMRQYLAPLLPEDLTSGFVREVLPWADLNAVDWQPLSSRARRRIMKRSILTHGFFALFLATLVGITPIPASPLHALWLPVIVLPLVFVRTTGWLRYSGWGMTDRAVFYRSGWLGRCVSVVAFDKVQTVTLRASPFDRRRQMASVVVDTAGAGSMGHRIDIPYLDQEVADSIYRRLYAEAASTEFDW